MLPEQDEFIETLFKAYFGRLTIYANAALQNPTRAAEVVQDAFHEAVRHIDTLMAHPNPGGWLMQTVKYKVKESERMHRRYVQRFLSLDTDLLPDFAVITHDFERVESEAENSLAAIQATLMQEEFYLLRRIVFESASHLEVAEELGISVWASQKRLERIRKKLEQAFPNRRRNE